MTTAEAILRTDISLPFQAARFSLSRTPLSCGTLPISLPDFAVPLPSCLDMVIKLADQASLSVPSPYLEHAGVRSFLTLCEQKEHELLGDRYPSYYAYLTVDNRLVLAGHTHRNAGWHFDGMQGTRYPIKLPACHQYVVTDCLPTEFACGPLQATQLDEAAHNWFVELSRQVQDSHPRFYPQPLEVVLMSAYQLHRAVPSPVTQRRMFLRLDYSLKQQDRLGNTLNPLLSVPWEYVRRDLPAHLQVPVEDTGWAHDRAFAARASTRPAQPHVEVPRA
jgi:hypothetical protein